MHIEAELKVLGSPAQRQVLMRFFKTGPGQYGAGDRFLGVKVPQIRAVVRRRADACTDAELACLLASPIHEVRLAGLLVLCHRYARAKGDEVRQAAVISCYLSHLDRVNNWDLVDVTCPALLGDWLLTHDRTILYELAEPNRTLWENRVAIVTTLQFVRHGQFTDTLALADRLLDHPHDLMHKAVGWLLREVGKRDLTALEAFLAPRYRAMPRTMLRYAIERLAEPRRQAYLHGRV